MFQSPRFPVNNSKRRARRKRRVRKKEATSSTPQPVESTDTKTKPQKEEPSVPTSGGRIQFPVAPAPVKSVVNARELLEKNVHNVARIRLLDNETLQQLKQINNTNQQLQLQINKQTESIEAFKIQLSELRKVTDKLQQESDPSWAYAAALRDIPAAGIKKDDVCLLVKYKSGRVVCRQLTADGHAKDFETSLSAFTDFSYANYLKSVADADTSA